MAALLGCIADDFTGATDIASFLVASGMRTIQLTELPSDHDQSFDDIDAIVIALKSRTEKAELAIKHSLAALQWLQTQGCQQFYFKYCSTFDSTDKGNIGPVADALLNELGESFTVVCPALPVNGRTVYKGHLFVNNMLLSESGMQNHPLTPMTDANLPRILSAQTSGKVDLIDINAVMAGAAELNSAIKKSAETNRYAIIDTISDRDLLTIGKACADLKLLTGGSGLAAGLADNFIAKGLLTSRANSAYLDTIDGDTIVLSGSCSQATREQVSAFQQRHASYKLDPLALSAGKQSTADAIAWFESNRAQGPLLIYATDTPESVKHYQAKLGIAHAGELIEQTMAAIATALISKGVSKFIVAGGETSGAVVKALDINALQVGPSIAPGVPVMRSLSHQPCLVALKSGNFGTEDFFMQAITTMQSL